VLRALRHRLGWRQVDVARAAALTQHDVSRAERGRLADLRKLRRHAAALDAEISTMVRWRGGEIDRVMDEGHATMTGWVVSMLADWGWDAHPEVTFAVRGERGAIDVLAWHAGSRTILVVEVKTELTSLEETLRRHDAKQRLAAAVGIERFNWQHPAAVCRLLTLPDLTTARRQVARHDAVLARAYRLRGADARLWLRSPTGAPSLLLFAPVTRGERRARAAFSRRRVRPARSSVSASGGSAAHAHNAY
jgi:transcriptional regulator with XRE-family HTH domain